MIYSLYIINKAGGLVYQRDFAEQLEKLSSNDYLVLAGTFHGYELDTIYARNRDSPLNQLFHSVHAITSKISPVPSSSGIEVLEAETFKLVCTQTLTGTVQPQLYHATTFTF